MAKIFHNTMEFVFWFTIGAAIGKGIIFAVVYYLVEPEPVNWQTISCETHVSCQDV